MVQEKIIAICHRTFNGKMSVKIWDLQLVLLSHPSTDAINPMLFQKEFEEPDPHPLRVWTMNTDEFQIVLSSEVRDGSNEPRTKTIFTLNFV